MAGWLMDEMERAAPLDDCLRMFGWIDGGFIGWLNVYAIFVLFWFIFKWMIRPMYDQTGKTHLVLNVDVEPNIQAKIKAGDANMYG